MADDDDDFLANERKRDPIEAVRESNALLRDILNAQKAEKEERKGKIIQAPPGVMMGVALRRPSRNEILSRMAKDWEAVKKAMPDAPDSIRSEVFRALTYAPPDDGPESAIAR